MPGPRWSMLELKVEDWSALGRWYVDVLGLEPRLRDEPREYLLLAAGDGLLALKGGGRPGRSAPLEDVRLFFEVDDVETESDRLRAAGVEVSAVRVDLEEGYREARLRDPEGTPIRLFDRPRALLERG